MARELSRFFSYLCFEFDFVHRGIENPRLRCEMRPWFLYARLGQFRAIWRAFPRKLTNGPSGGQKARKTKIRKK